MRTTEQAVRNVIGAEAVYVGIDVHKESWHVTVRGDGEERFNGRIPGQYASLRKVLERYRDVRIKVAYEAGPFGFWLLDRLVQDGIETIVVPPSSLLSQAIRSRPTRGTAANLPHRWKRTCSSGSTY